MLKTRIKELREKNNLSQDKLGKFLNLSQQAIAKWEKGKAEPDSANINNLAKIFDCSVEYLLGNTNDPTPINKEKEPTPEIGSFEWLRQGLIARGVIKDGEDITAEQLEILLANIDTIASVLKQHTTQNVQQ